MKHILITIAALCSLCANAQTDTMKLKNFKINNYYLTGGIGLVPETEATQSLMGDIGSGVYSNNILLGYSVPFLNTKAFSNRLELGIASFSTGNYMNDQFQQYYYSSTAIKLLYQYDWHYFQRKNTSIYLGGGAGIGLQTSKQNNLESDLFGTNNVQYTSPIEKFKTYSNFTFFGINHFFGEKRKFGFKQEICWGGTGYYKAYLLMKL